MRRIAPNPRFQLGVDDDGPRPITPTIVLESIFHLSLEFVPGLCLLAATFPIEHHKGVKEPFPMEPEELVPSEIAPGVFLGVRADRRGEGTNLQ